MQGEVKIQTAAKGLRTRRSRRKRAITLIEASMGLALFALVAGYAVQMVANYMETNKARNVAEKMTDVSEASKKYLKANYAALISSIATGSVKEIDIGRDNATTTPSATSVQGQGFLPDGFIDVNGFGQHHALLVKKTSADRLDALVTTYGGRTIPDRLLATIGTFVGNSGGYVLDTPVVAADANKIVGAYGGYRSTLSYWGSTTGKPVAGHFQSSLAFEDGKLLADYLYRNDIGIPEANRMNTAIDMNNNDINNGGTFTAQHLKAAIDVWSGQDVLADRDVIAGRDVAAGRDVHANNDVVAEKDLSAGQDLDVTRNGRIGGNLAVTGNATVAGNATVTGNAKVDGTSDLATMDLTRTIAIVPNRFGQAEQVKLSDLLPRQVAQYSYVVKEGQIVPKPDCTGGYTKARIMVFRQVDSIKGYPQVRLVTTSQSGYITSVAQDIPNSFVNVADGIVANNGSSFWTVNWIGSLPADGATRQAIAQTYCYYG